jgi:iron(III) transport system ATP-binding protein
MVFQGYAIWPQMTVYENVAFPLLHGRKKFPKTEVADRVRWALKLVQLEGLAERQAPHLSGGQQQRVALARAIVDQPKVLLLDEPLSNLDAKLREDMRLELRQLVSRLRTTTVYVTHDQTEALSMSDRVAVMREGKIVQEGNPREIYYSPANAFVADFVGKINLLPGQVVNKEGDDVYVETAVGQVHFQPATLTSVGDELVLAVRPESIRVSPEQNGWTENVFEGRVEVVSFIGDALEGLVSVGNRTLRVKVDPFVDMRLNGNVYVHMPAERLIIMPPQDPNAEIT